MTDFVPVIVAFLGISLERGEADRIGLRRYLLETLLIDGIELLLSALSKCESPYVHLVEALSTALSEDIRQLAGGAKWQPPADLKEPLPAAVCGLTPTLPAPPEKGVEL